MTSPFLCGSNLADILQKEVDSRKKAQELSTSIRDVRQAPSSFRSVIPGFFKAPPFRKGKKKKDKRVFPFLLGRPWLLLLGIVG